MHALCINNHALWMNPFFEILISMVLDFFGFENDNLYASAMKHLVHNSGLCIQVQVFMHDAYIGPVFFMHFGSMHFS